MENKFFRLASNAKSLVLNATTGEKIIAEAENTFCFIDSDFQNLKTNEKELAAEETDISICEIKRDTLEGKTFSQIFKLLLTDLDKLCLTQEQIINFCQKHHQYLKRYYCCNTYFLSKSDGHLFIVHLELDCAGDFSLLDGLLIHAREFESECKWGNIIYTEKYIVVPRLDI